MKNCIIFKKLIKKAIHHIVNVINVIAGVLLVGAFTAVDSIEFAIVGGFCMVWLLCVAKARGYLAHDYEVRR